jgi:SnoaL-like protein
MALEIDAYSDIYRIVTDLLSINFHKEGSMAAKSMETALQEVIDREEIRTLPVRYCDTVWQKDLDGYVNLFTEDGSISTSDSSLPATTGRENLRKMIGTGLDEMKPRPFIHNHVVELLGPDRAKGRCYIEVKLVRNGKKHAMAGWYNDEYAKVNGEWKFKSRHIMIDSAGPVNE